jgi:predicted N-acetyltransferase YhbS
MKFSKEIEGRENEIVGLFKATFTDSEGADEGALIGSLVNDFLVDTPQRDIHVFTAMENGALIGAAIFSRLTYSDDPRIVFILSPMAVATDRHAEGIGQALLTHALKVLREEGVDVVITYGDPAFYGKLGFAPLSEATAPPPLPLSHPEGWIGQSLTEATLAPLQGNCACVEALNAPDLW